MTISIHQAKKSDWKAIAEFINEAYNSVAPFKGFARWNWQFVANPFHDERSDLVPVWIAKDAGKIVGQIAVQPAIVRIDDQEHPAGWMVDVIDSSRISRPITWTSSSQRSGPQCACSHHAYDGTGNSQNGITRKLRDSGSCPGIY